MIGQQLLSLSVLLALAAPVQGQHHHTADAATTASTPHLRTARSLQQTGNSIIGFVDTIHDALPGSGANTDAAYVFGWACQVQSAAPISVHVYAGNDVILAVREANLPSETAVNNLCRGGGVGYRFRVPLSMDDMIAHGGEGLTVRGVAANGRTSALLKSPSSLKVPKTMVRGFLDTVVAIQPSKAVSVRGWACQEGSAAPLTIKLYVEGKSGSPGLEIMGTANQHSEGAVAALCRTSSSAHRYSFVVPPEELVNYVGQPVHVFGVSAHNNENKLLPSSKQQIVPDVGVVNSSSRAAPVAPTMTSSVPSSNAPFSSLIASKNQDITIPAGTVFELDADAEVGLILVQGTLQCPSTAKTIHLRTHGIVVAGSRARLDCGTSATSPSPVQLDITLAGNRDGQLVYGNIALGPRAIVAIDGGTIRLHGQSGREGFQPLVQTAPAGSRVLRVQNTAEWQVGDRIVVTSSDFDPAQAEERTIQSISADRKSVTVEEPMRYLHWGSTEQYSNGKGNTWTLDERAEVFNLNRSITIKSDNDGLARSEFIGTHMIIRGANSAGYVDNVEFVRGGQAGEMGRYPFHWHHAGDVKGQYIKNSSIHHTYQRCVVIHQSNYATIQGNTCFDHFGHGYFLEDGNEVKNVITDNLGVLSRVPSTERALLQSDITGDPLRFAPTATFWISHPDNTVERNVAAGSEGSGFWMAFVRETDAGVHPPATPMFERTLAFRDNRAHSCVVGITHDGAPVGPLAGNPNNPADRAVGPVHYSPPEVPVFENLVAFKCSESGLYFRGNRATYRNAIVADNKRSIFFSNDQDVIDSLVVGTSSNVALPGTQPTLSGVMVYDGPLWLETVHFENFSAAGTMAIDKIGAARLWTDQFQGLTFKNVQNKIRSYLGNTVWSDEMCSSVRDVDGSLTGLPNHVVVPDHPWNDDPSVCRKSQPGEFTTLVCNYDVSYLWFVDLNTGESNDMGITTTRVGGSSAAATIVPQNFRNKLSMIQNDTYSYRVDGLSYARGAKYLVQFSAMRMNISSPLVTFPNLPRSCRVTRNGSTLRSYRTVAHLNGFTSTGTLREGNHLTVKFSTSSNAPEKRSDTYRGEGNYQIEC